jgi:hypothetical protein
VIFFEHALDFRAIRRYCNGSNPGERIIMFWTKIRKILGAILILVCLAAGLLMILSARVFGAESAIICVGLAAFFGVLAGILFVRFYLYDISEAFTGFLLFPRRFLKETPFETGAVYALMRGPDPAKAEDFLNALPPEQKRRPEAALARIELYRDHLGRPEAALTAAEEYLALSGRRKNPCGKAILLAFADLATDLGEPHKACEMLKRELRRPFYTDTEKSEIRLRLDFMTEQIGS